MTNGLGEISSIITYCESYWETQIEEIKSIINNFEPDKQKTSELVAENILNRANNVLSNSESYSIIIQKILNNDLMQGVRIYKNCLLFCNVFNSFSPFLFKKNSDAMLEKDTNIWMVVNLLNLLIYMRYNKLIN
jgi:hypothetical protein